MSNPQDLSSLTERVEKLEKAVYNLKLMYKPPGHPEHINVVDYLDAVDDVIKRMQRDILSISDFVK